LLRPQHAGHRGQQSRRRVARGVRIAAGLVILKALDPIDFGIEQQHLAENIGDTGDQDAEDDAVDRGVSHEGVDELAPEHHD
jgi:hypothetical protein